tara:strand:- start:812 stop:1321 length:510 start_codon:yes stop_codon:yes gene_type:complete
MTDELNFKNICSIGVKTMGTNIEELTSQTRKMNIVVLRQVLAVLGRTEEDIHRTIIAKILNRDRTSINYYENSHKNNYSTFPLYRETFNKVYKAYKDVESTKNVFFDSQKLKSFLLNNGVREVEKADVTIEVKSGSAKCLIKTNYFEVSNQIENIKLACKEYHITISIK